MCTLLPTKPSMENSRLNIKGTETYPNSRYFRRILGSVNRHGALVLKHFDPVEHRLGLHGRVFIVVIIPGGRRQWFWSCRVRRFSWRQDGLGFGRWSGRFRVHHGLVRRCFIRSVRRSRVVRGSHCSVTVILLGRIRGAMRITWESMRIGLEGRAGVVGDRRGRRWWLFVARRSRFNVPWPIIVAYWGHTIVLGLRGAEIPGWAILVRRAGFIPQWRRRRLVGLRVAGCGRRLG